MTGLTEPIINRNSVGLHCLPSAIQIYNRMENTSVSGLLRQPVDVAGHTGLHVGKLMRATRRAQGT